MKSLSAFLILLSLASTACAGVVTGTATYLARIAMPPGAVFEATLEDVSLADAPAKVLGQTRTESPGNPPIHFEIAYDDGRIEPSHRYAVRTRVLLDKRLMFTSDRIYPVLTQGAGNAVEILMRGVSAPKQPKQTAGLGSLPASFEGDLPCADCPGIRFHLDLFADRVYYQRMEYLERNLVLDSLGNWIVSGDGKKLSLTQNGQIIDRFAIQDSTTLRKLDGEGQEIDSSLNYGLKRAAAFKAIEPKLKLRGLYSYMADAGVFIECQSHLRLPVVTEQDNAALESAYSTAPHTQAERVIAEVEGRVALRPKMEGAGEQPSLVVERFITLGQPGEACGGPVATANLQNTLWNLTFLGQEPVKPQENQRTPNLVLQSQQPRVGGFGGCNRLMGSYVLEGDKLSFGKMASTMMACPPAQMALEKAFHDALATVKAWRIDGERLELIDETGKSVARFESLYLR